MLNFLAESWLWYGIVMVVVILRFTSRLLHLKSILRLQIEDYLMIVLTCAYTIYIVIINICAVTNSNLIDPDNPPIFTPEEIAERTYGSKIILGVEQLMCLIQWGTKACLLLLYYQLTENLAQNKFVKLVGVYVAVTYVIMEVLYFGYWCRPFTDYWKTPTDNYQCTTAYNHLVVNLSFNLSCDLLVMSIPLPLLLRAHLSIKRKILLCFPFTLGFFSIICAVLSKYVSLTNPFSPVWTFWYTREASCVMIVANMPYTWGLIRRLFKLKSFWGRANTESECDSIDIDRTHDGRTGMVHGEMREILGRPVDSAGSVQSAENDRFDAMSKEIDLKGKSMPEMNIDVKEISERPSPTITCSSASTSEEQWKYVGWDRAASETDITQMRSGHNSLSPDTLLPPSPALLQSNGRRPSTADGRRGSFLGSRRASAYSNKGGLSSLSEVSRHSTRTSVHVDVVDRLYRLDDEGLMADLEVKRSRSRNSFRDGMV